MKAVEIGSGIRIIACFQQSSRLVGGRWAKGPAKRRKIELKGNAGFMKTAIR